MDTLECPRLFIKPLIPCVTQDYTIRLQSACMFCCLGELREAVREHTYFQVRGRVDFSLPFFFQKEKKLSDTVKNEFIWLLREKIHICPGGGGTPLPIFAMIFLQNKK